jgi:hypothetical protein
MMVDENLVANIKVFNFTAYFSNYPRRLMSKNQRRTVFKVPSHQI